MKTHLSIFLALSFFCIVLALPHVAALTTATETAAEDDSEDNNELEAALNSDSAFTVRRETLTMSDGVRLAVSYWMPRAEEPGEKFPVFFELNGYRKDDLCYLSWDYPVGAYFAKHGYVVAKVDLRGTGDSEGVLP